MLAKRGLARWQWTEERSPVALSQVPTKGPTRVDAAFYE